MRARDRLSATIDGRLQGKCSHLCVVVGGGRKRRFHDGRVGLSVRSDRLKDESMEPIRVKWKRSDMNWNSSKNGPIAKCEEEIKDSI